MALNLEPDSKVKDDNSLESAKHEQPSTSTEAGRRIDLSDKQPQNAFTSMSRRFAHRSNLNEVCDFSSERHIGESTVNDAGRQREFKSVHPENTCSSIIASCETEPKLNEHRLEQSEKQCFLNNRTVLECK
jgi:hypothetical protein